MPISDANLYKFSVSLEFKEEDGKGGYSTSPKDKNVFKLRCDLEKKLIITVTQTSQQGHDLKIERYALQLHYTFILIQLFVMHSCFGLLISPGRNVKNNEMHLVDMARLF
jgi:predicted NACHT family NTPase